jgi:hypothetical protein
MGLGDWIISTADAAEAHKKHGCRVVFGDGENKYWSSVFENNKKIAKDPLPEETLAWVANFPGNRPYMEKIDKDRFYPNKHFRAKPGEVFLTDQERSFSKRKDYVLIEPNVKDWVVGFNKAWRFDYWQEVVKLDLPWLQTGPGWVLDGVEYVYTPSFREALVMVENAALVVTTDGALHHAAAAMGVPAVVIWGGLISPQILGYDSHINLCKAEDFCGSLKHCEHCRKALDSVTPDEVKKVLKRLL